MCPGFHDIAFVKHENPVGADHTGKSMGEDKRGSPSHKTIQRFLDNRLVLSVD